MNVEFSLVSKRVGITASRRSNGQDGAGGRWWIVGSRRLGGCAGAASVR